jgi:hypothetical protein
MGAFGTVSMAAGFGYVEKGYILLPIADEMSRIVLGSLVTLALIAGGIKLFVNNRR